MPLNTDITRDGKQMKLRWGEFHVAAMVLATAMDSGVGPFPDNSLKGIFETEDASARLGISPGTSFMVASYGPIGATPLNDGPYTLKGPFTFVDTTDGEVFELKAGDVLHAWRSF